LADLKTFTFWPAIKPLTGRGGGVDAACGGEKKKHAQRLLLKGREFPEGLLTFGVR
jgi:hypothetical protein